MLTRLGWEVLVAALVLYAGGWLLGYPELAVLAAGGLIAVGGALLWTLPQSKLAVRREIAPLKVARADPAVAVLTIKNSGRFARTGLRAMDRCGTTEMAVDIPRLPRAAGRTVSYQVPTGKRGETPVGPLRLIRADPFGLSRRVREYGEAITLLVRPRSVALPPMPSGRSLNLDGTSSDTAPRGTVTFHTLREYVMGDDMRHIHWRSTARTGTLMVKQLVDVTLPLTTVVLDIRRSAYASEDDFELAVDVTASVAASAARHNFPVRVLTGAGPLIDSKGGPEEAELVLDRLALVAMTGEPTNVIDAVRRVRAGGSLVVVTGNGDQLGQVASVRRRFTRVVCARVGHGELETPSIPGVVVVDAADLDVFAAGWQREARR